MPSTFKRSPDFAPIRYRTPSPPTFEAISPVLTGVAADEIPILCSSSTTTSATPFSHSKISTSKGVRINCDGDIDVLGSAKYTAIEISPDDPILVADIATVSEALQAPLRMRQCPPDPAWKDDNVTGRYDNQAATFLMRCMDPAREEWSMAPMSWQDRVGSVVVVRADGEDITPQQVEAMSYYAQYELEDAVQDASESGSKKERVKVAALFTPGKFREFFTKFKAKKAGEDPSWDAAICLV